ncbi:hypothetical protein YTPLAS73_05300 [Nitrosarchaeum sp.]|nr:hypothetical protein YTPLAS73_05300 [Nitrosarchaeum sp.]
MLEIHPDEITQVNESPLAKFYSTFQSEYTKNDYERKLKRILCEFLAPVLVGNPEKVRHDIENPHKCRKGRAFSVSTADFEDIVGELDETHSVADVETSEPGGGCLIATAAYGTELSPQVQFLREIRDNTVMSTSSGAAFMTGFNQLYYLFSPTIADLERENPMFQEAVRAFITPMISTLSIMTLAEDGNESQVFGLGVSIIALNLGMYIAAPALVGYTVSKRLRK